MSLPPGRRNLGAMLGSSVFRIPREEYDLTIDALLESAARRLGLTVEEAFCAYDNKLLMNTMDKLWLADLITLYRSAAAEEAALGELEAEFRAEIARRCGVSE
ncbi:MAG TPA: hypothetical protein VM328_10980 [Fimbriimonadaceae bacterium]|nr:hypothetical protein [Fimbriimonadaceae bacterium]